MTGFEFVFPLFGLLVGLSYAEMLAGLARSLKNKRDVHVGWLTPLLGLVVLLNLTMIWLGAWDMRNVAEPSSTGMLFILIVGGAYFLAASMVFPATGAEVRDLDEHFMEHRKVALLTIATCNSLYIGRVAIAHMGEFTAAWWAGNALFVALVIVAALVPSRRVIFSALLFLVGAHMLLLLLGGTSSAIFG